MPVMKRLTVDGVNYDTVGEASVTQVQTSGTKIATVTIDGTATDLYAPEGGGGGPEPSSTTPAMDGTAAVGTATTYARADHVHPTDTSRQATLVSGTNIRTVNGTSLLGSGDISVQPTLVSGTNIKTVNSTSLLGSGDISVQPTLVSGTNIKTVGGTSLLGSGDIPITITMEDTDVDAAVEEAWPGYSVTVSLTHPLYGENFNTCQIEGYADGGNITDILGLIIDPAGSMTVAFDSDTYEYLSLMFDARWGASFMESNITCTGGVSYYTETAMTDRLFVVTGSGTITINGIDYDD